MKHLPLIVVGVGVFLGIALVTLWLQGTFSLPKMRAYTHMHCPECGLEMAFQSHLNGKTCTQCGPTGPKFVNTVGPWANRDAGGRGGLLGNYVVAGIIGLAGAAVSVYGLILYNQARAAAAAEESNRLLVCHCPFCERKIGYTPGKGTTAICPVARPHFVLPEHSCQPKCSHC